MTGAVVLDGVFEQVLAKDPQRLLDGAVRDHQAAVEHDGAVTEGPHLVGLVRDQQDRASLFLEGADPVDALRLKPFVTHGEDLVDDENVGINVNRHRESETDIHATRVELHLGVDEVLNLTEGNDIVEDRVHAPLGESKHRTVEIDVVATRQLGLKSRS